MKLTAKIDGFDAVGRKLDQIVASVDGRKRGEELEQAAQPILARMQELVSVRTGYLRDSLAIVAADDGLTVRIGPVGKAAWRAHFLEFGTINMPADPFILPAFDSEKSNFTTKVAKQMRSSIMAAAKG